MMKSKLFFIKYLNRKDTFKINYATIRLDREEFEDRFYTNDAKKVFTDFMNDYASTEIDILSVVEYNGDKRKYDSIHINYYLMNFVYYDEFYKMWKIESSLEPNIDILREVDSNFKLNVMLVGNELSYVLKEDTIALFRHKLRTTFHTKNMSFNILPNSNSISELKDVITDSSDTKYIFIFNDNISINQLTEFTELYKYVFVYGMIYGEKSYMIDTSLADEITLKRIILP